MIRYLDSHFISVTDTNRLRDTLLPGLLQSYGAALVAVFLHGSRATRGYRSDSDLDLMIVIAASALSKVERLHRVPIPADYRGPPVTPVVLTVDEFRRFPPIVLSLLDAHEVWWSASGQSRDTPPAAQLLDELQRYVREEGIERVPFRGRHYWRKRGSGAWKQRET